MTKRNTPRSNSKSPPRDRAASPPQPSNGPIRLWLALLFLLVSAGASLMMVLDHFAVMGLPGCGVGSGCAKAAASVWGKVPVINLPTSSVGLAYFIAAAIGWIVGRGQPSASFTWIVRVGVLISLGLLAVIAIERHLCSYCVAAHLGNLLFWIVMETSRRTERPSLAPVLVACGLFAAELGAMAAIEAQQKRTVAEKAAAELAESTQRIIEKTAAPTSTAAQAVHEPPGGFTSRWRIGPENAPIRIVIFSDFQCSDCTAFETQVRALLQQRQDVSVAAKHFPLCADCNVYVTKTIHPNACWAARAAEAAGILQGNEGFWKMHHWLFDRMGSFTSEELPIGLRQLGFEPDEFIRIMTSDQSLQPIKADVEEGTALGLYFTPMVFINGVELRGFYGNPNALKTAIDALAATNPQPGSALQDKPPLAAGKAVGDWREGIVQRLPPKALDWSLGPADAPIKVWVWGDYQNSITRELDQAIRSAMAKRTSGGGAAIQYIYRHYPMDKLCNPNMQQTVSNAACWAARAAEAAGSLGGNDAYWKMHEWLMSNQSNFNDAALRAAVPQLGLNPEALIAAMASPQVQAAVAQDVASGRPLIVQGVPTIYVNGKWVARWKLGTIPVLELILDEAGQ